VVSCEPRDESSIRTAWEAGDMPGATTGALKCYGPELLGFLTSFHEDYDVAADAFAVFSQRLWETLPSFRWDCSLRTWCYRLARNAAIDVTRGELRKRRGQIGLSSAPEVLAVANRTRTETLSILRTEKRTALERLRAELPEEDRTLLVLRVDRNLGWREIAHVLWRTGDAPDAAWLTREAARLRKRFQLVKERLRRLARERGLLPVD
jgi:RNA polymerase sigma-70 factor (ECF subfamily)